MTPNVRHAFIMRLIDDAMRADGWSGTTLPHGIVRYWPRSPATEVIDICVPVTESAAVDPFAVAQGAIDARMAELAKVRARRKRAA